MGGVGVRVYSIIISGSSTRAPLAVTAMWLGWQRGGGCETLRVPGRGQSRETSNAGTILERLWTHKPETQCFRKSDDRKAQIQPML